MIKKIRRHSRSSARLIVLFILASVAQAQAVTDFDLPAQSLGEALRAVAGQTNSNILFDGEMVSGLSVKALKAQMTTEAALERLLIGTGLAFRYLDEKTVTIVPAGAPAAFHRTALAGTNTAGVVLLAGQTAAAPAAAGNDERRIVLEEIIVTAQKRRENVREVPIAMSVISSEHLEQFHATRLADFVNYVPGIQIINGGSPGQNIITLRGISPIGPNQTVGVYIDDAPVGSSGFLALESLLTADLLPYDIERIEVLRGPQGTLYGASGNAGLLKYVTRAPDLSNFEVRAGTEVYDMESANDVGWAGRLGINAPLIEGKVAVRASYAYQRTPGYVDNIVLGIEDQNEVSQESGRIALLWQASDDISLKLAGMWQSIDSDNNASSLLNNPSRTLVADDYSLDNQRPEPFKRGMSYYTATLDWALSWADFVSATSYSDTKNRITVDNSQAAEFVLTTFFGLPGSLAEFLLALDLEKWTQEFRLASPSGGRVEWLLGAFYTDEDSSNNQTVSVLTQAGEPIPGLNPFLAAALPSQYQEYAVFGNLTYKFTERFDVTAGLRWARNDQDFRQIAGGPLAELFGLVGNSPGDSSESVVTYSVAPRLRLNQDTMIYARVGSGYRPGGPNVIVPGARPQADSDLLTSYEIGVKTELFDGRMVVDAAVFRMEWKDIQTTVAAAPPNEDFAFLDNAGEAWSQGVELATIFTPVKALRLGVNAAYAETELTEVSPNAALFLPGRAGDGLPRVPKWSASVTADYEFPLGAWRGRVGAGYRYVDERLSGFDSDPLTLLEDSYRALDLNAEVSAQNWTLRLFATNVTDEKGQVSLGQANNPAFLSALLLQPRIVGLSLDVSF